MNKEIYSDTFTYNYKVKILQEFTGRDYKGTPETRLDQLLIEYGNKHVKPDPIKIYEYELVPDINSGDEWIYSKNRNNFCIF